MAHQYSSENGSHGTREASPCDKTSYLHQVLRGTRKRNPRVRFRWQRKVPRILALMAAEPAAAPGSRTKTARILGEASSGPATTRIGFEKAWRSIMEATEAAAARAGLTREDFARMHAGIGLAGLGRRGAEAALNKIAHPFASVIFISDGLAACLGAHSGADGAIVVAGTGSVGIGLIDGREIRLAGYGFPVSDEGSGADIGLQVVRLALRAADRRGETDPIAFRGAGRIRS